MVEHLTRHPCDGCTDRVNAINGRYCRKLHHYVEHHTQPGCRHPASYHSILARLKQQ